MYYIGVTQAKEAKFDNLRRELFKEATYIAFGYRFRDDSWLKFLFAKLMVHVVFFFFYLNILDSVTWTNEGRSVFGGAKNAYKGLQNITAIIYASHNVTLTKRASFDIQTTWKRNGSSV